MTKIAGSKTDTIRRLRSSFQRAYNKNPEVSAVMAPPPTLTAGTTADGSLGKTYVAGTMQNQMTVTGGKFYYSTTNSRGCVVTQNRSGDGGNAAIVASPSPAMVLGDHCIGPYYYKFMTDAPKLQPRFAPSTTGYPMRIIVDGLYVDLVGSDFITNNYLTIDFGSRKPRLIEFECQYPMTFFSIAVDSLSRIWKPVPVDTVRAVITGDSHTECDSGLTGTVWSGCSPVMARELGIWDMCVASVGGTGYLHMGTSGLRKTIRSQMDDWVQNGSYHMITFAGGYNDTGDVVSNVQAEALLCWQKARQYQPNAFIVVFGIWGSATGPSSGVTTLETALQATFTAWNDNFSVFIPVSTAAEAWEFGTGKIGTTNGSGNSDVYVSSDGVHCGVVGHKQRGERLANAIREQVFAFAA
jgi:lysophospholipase L1-like esterase